MVSTNNYTLKKISCKLLNGVKVQWCADKEGKST